MINQTTANIQVFPQNLQFPLTGDIVHTVLYEQVVCQADSRFPITGHDIRDRSGKWLYSKKGKPSKDLPRKKMNKLPYNLDLEFAKHFKLKFYHTKFLTGSSRPQTKFNLALGKSHAAKDEFKGISPQTDLDLAPKGIGDIPYLPNIPDETRYRKLNLADTQNILGGVA